MPFLRVPVEGSDKMVVQVEHKATPSAQGISPGINDVHVSTREPGRSCWCLWCNVRSATGTTCRMKIPQSTTFAGGHLVTLRSGVFPL